jgi:hypothetical protein
MFVFIHCFKHEYVFKRSAGSWLPIFKDYKKGLQESGKYKAYLFVYFTGAGDNQESIRFALSNDGYNLNALNNISQY